MPSRRPRRSVASGSSNVDEPEAAADICCWSVSEGCPPSKMLISLGKRFHFWGLLIPISQVRPAIVCSGVIVEDKGLDGMVCFCFELMSSAYQQGMFKYAGDGALRRSRWKV